MIPCRFLVRSWTACSPRGQDEGVPETLFPDAAALARGVCRAFDQRGYASLLEFPLACGRRADVMALARSGELAIVEIKSSIADFRADRKWPEYRDWCDRLYFAVGDRFPREVRTCALPPRIGEQGGCARLRERASTDRCCPGVVRDFAQRRAPRDRRARGDHDHRADIQRDSNRDRICGGSGIHHAAQCRRKVRTGCVEHLTEGGMTE